VTYVGGLYPAKGVHYLTQAWPEVLSEFPDAKLNIIGSGKLYSRDFNLGTFGIAESSFEKQLLEPLLDENGDIIDEKGTVVKMYKCILKVVGNEGANLWSNMELDPEFTGDTFRDKFISSWYNTIDDGRDPEELFRQIIKCFGFDGIIMDAGRFSNMQHTRGTKHYIVFSPNQIKSVYNRNPTKNSDITKE
jgi:glycosyltransferase involved in cell wall biosynthesis